MQPAIKCIGISLGFVLISNFVHAQSAPKSNQEEKEIQFPKASQFSNTKLTYKIIVAVNNTFAYDIYADGKLMIHQNSIPAMPGNEGFKTKVAAEKIAKLVIEKIKKGEMPPTVSINEMKKLKAIK